MRVLPGTSRTPAGAWRVAVVAVLLAFTAAGLRSRGAFSHAPDRALAGVSGAVLATVLIAAEGAALVAFVIVLAMARPRRKPRPDEDEPPRPPFPWWAKSLAVLASVAVLVTPFAVLFTRRTRPRTARPGVLAGGAAGPNRLPAAAHGSPWPLIAGMLIALVVLVALTVWSGRTRRRPPRPAGDRNRQALGQSLAAGRAALAGTLTPRDPRAAIIACYAAMEAGFAAAGSAPAAADTPAEVLARATGAGLVRSGPADRMTGLFRRARYSSEPMTGAEAAAAASALDEMQADLGHDRE